MTAKTSMIGRVRVEDSGSAVRLVIPSRKDSASLVAFGCLLPLMVVTGTIAGVVMVRQGLFIILFPLLFWSAGAAAMTIQLAWSIFGHEIVVFDGRELKVDRWFGGRGRKQRYSLDDAEDWRVWNAPTIPWRQKLREGWVREQRGPIFFTYYGELEIDFGEGLTRAEAEQLLWMLRERCLIRDKQVANGEDSEEG